ncbi:carbohydrate ABC transporter permease [uncultured Jatrophihabitans sp.]|uniref:carbohydrate ABC transporter permease n=1 Tax=uncultured Jatrophihabitans sp. TaxID=1610747 RepID=UPI0035CAFEAB
MPMEHSLLLASTASEAGSRLLGVVEVVAAFLAILAVIFLVVGRVSGRAQRPIALAVCLLPALVLVAVGLVIPAIDTIVNSFKNQQYLGQQHTSFIGFDNYRFDFTDSDTQRTLLNTLQWLVIVPVASVAVGLTAALLLGRMRHTGIWKTLIFLPTAISFVGAAVIWNYVYDAPVQGGPQTGLLSRIALAFGWHNPPNWLISSPLNLYLEMIIMIWIQAGFAMVVLSAALNAIPDDIIEAARMDGASGLTLFRTVQVPMIRNTLVVVGTTIMIATLKVFDIVFSLNNGNFNTDVLARQMYGDLFVTNQVSRGSSLAVILFVVVLPLVLYNIRQLRRERATR